MLSGFIFLIGAFLMNSLGTVLVKVHSVRGFQVKGNILEIVFGNIFFLSALLLFGLNLVFYSFALTRLPLSIAYPIMTVASFIIVNIFSFFYFKEHITTVMILGYVFILVGISLVIIYSQQ